MIPVGALTFLQSPGLSPLWNAAHARLVRNGRTVSGQLTLDGLDDNQRDALGRLLARDVGARHTVKLAELDRLLWESAAGTGLLGVVETIVGAVPDRRADAAAEAARRSLLRDRADAALAAAGLAECEWAPEWLDLLWRQGLPARLSSDDIRRVLGQATMTLGLTVGQNSSLWSRGDLAQRVTGTAHGLDDDNPLTRLVLRGLALAVTGRPDYPADAGSRRALWESAGVTNDTVATTVLTYGLRPLRDDWLRSRADACAETHLTWRELRRRGSFRLAPQTVYVCENPRVLEAAANAGAAVAIVCTMGNPTTVTQALLAAVTSSSGVRLAYHGDFDWPGIAIANRIVRQYGARPWRFTTEDYRRAVSRAGEHGTPLPPLAGRPVDAAWDPALTMAMREMTVAVHEEAVIESLLDDLRSG